MLTLILDEIQLGTA